MTGVFVIALALVIGLGTWAGLTGRLETRADTMLYSIYGRYTQDAACGSSNSPTAYPTGVYNPYRGSITESNAGVLYYEIPNVPNGTYRVTVGGASCGTTQIEDRYFEGQCSTPSATVVVNNISSHAPDMRSFGLSGAAWIKVSHEVPRPGGRRPGIGPAPYATVQIMSGTTVVAKSSTNIHGNAGFSNIPGGSYRVEVTFKGLKQTGNITVTSCQVVPSPQTVIFFDDL